MFWKKARKIKELQRYLDSANSDLKRAGQINKALGKEKDKIIEEKDLKIKELSGKLNELLKLSDKLKSAIEKSKKLDTELKQAKNAHISYKKDLAKLNSKIDSQEKKIGKVLET
jgi:chromosome segregation ATPase